MTQVEVRHLTVRYPGQKIRVLKDVSFSIQKGENVLLVGPSGGGKSTLSLVLNGIVPHSIEAEVQGDVRINGRSLHEVEVTDICREVGILFQDPESQFCMQTVEDEIVFGLENVRFSRAEMEQRIEHSLALTGMSSRRDRFISELSGGLQQKLGLACLLALGQSLLILDEPTANLDPNGARDVIELLARLAQDPERSLLLIEHQLDRVAGHMDRVLVLGEEGTLLYDDAPRQLFHEHGDALMRLGIQVPQVCVAAKQLEAAGFNWELFPLTLQEWETGLHKAKWGDAERPSSIPWGVEFAPDRGALDSGRDRMRAASEPLVAVRDVVFAYGAREVVQGVRFNVWPGEWIALLGGNGAGKSTLAQLLAKLLSPQSGSIEFAGKTLDDWNAHQLYRQLGFVFQNPEHQFVTDTVEKELAFGLTNSGLDDHEVQHRVEQQLQLFSLAACRHRHPFQLSQGQKRRLSVATMLVNNPSLLLLDEPTFGQDEANTRHMMQLLKQRQREGTAVIMITHDLELVRKYVERVLVLDGGKIGFDGSKEQFFADEKQLSRFGMEPPLSLLLEASLAVKERILPC